LFLKAHMQHAPCHFTFLKIKIKTMLMKPTNNSEEIETA
jgi:hypothetical protein